MVAAILGVGCLGCQKSKPPVGKASATAQNDWSDFIDPGYAARDFAQFAGPLGEDLESSQTEVTNALVNQIQILKQTGGSLPGPDQRFSECDWFDEMKAFRLRDLHHYMKTTSDTGEAKKLAA